MGESGQHLPFFKTSPTESERPIRVKKDKVLDISRKQQILLLGFDTEYQFNEEANRNDVISYQFSAQIVHSDPDIEQGLAWQNIVLPRSFDLDDRLSISEFISIVISEGIRLNPDIQIPKTIYLFAHYTNADIPAFSEFKDDIDRRNLKLENIRKTFVNVNRDIRCYINDSDTNEQIELRVIIRDTMHIAAGGKSLDDIGQLIGVEKVKIADNPEDELEKKRNMISLYEENWDLFREYAMTDAVIAQKYALKLLRLYQNLTGKFGFPLTLTSIGVDLLIKNWNADSSDPALSIFKRDNPWDGLSLAGREEHTERFWSDRKGRYVTKKSTPLIKKLFWREAFFTEGYHGGRNEQFWFGPLPEALWYDYDLTSAYPSVMSLIGYPIWNKIRSIHGNDDLLELKHTDLAVANVDFEFPDNVRFPCLPIRTEGGLIFPKKGNTTAHISEILVAAHLGAKINLIEGQVVPTIRFHMGSAAIRPFLTFALDCIQRRREHPKGSLENAFWKEMVNSTYGKTAQGLQKRRVYDLRSGESKDLAPSKITNPFYASMITGFCRATLAEIMNGLPDDVMICSVTTDGFATNASPAQMDEITSTLIKGYPWEDGDCDFEQYPPNTCAGYYREASKLLAGVIPYAPGQKSIYEVKHISRQLLGWRTRGQATLKPADGADLAAVGLSKIDEGYVLAATGLDFPKFYSKPDRNAETVELFLNRQPDLSLPKKRLHGIRDMYEMGFDAVTYDTKLAVSMEYDWKRRPTKAVDFELSNGSTHLQFQTVPWDDIVQYNQARSNWFVYTKSSRKCLKTVSDLEAFNLYNTSKTSLELTGAGRYLRKEGGDLKRLRQQITVAWELRRAGTHDLRPHAFGNKKIFPTKKLKSQELSDFLNEVGIPCKKSDVGNDRKKARKTGFIPRQVPRNDRTKGILYRLKKELFPELNIDEFLTEEVVDLYLDEQINKQGKDAEKRYHQIGKRLVREAIAEWKRLNPDIFKRYYRERRKFPNTSPPLIGGAWSKEEIDLKMGEGLYAEILAELPKHSDVTEADIWMEAMGS